MICALCGSAQTHLLVRMPDNKNVIRSIYSCSDCFALTPDYEAHRVCTTNDQVTFHENYWAEVNERDLQQDLVNLRGLVVSLEKYLGAPSSDTRVFEIGAGRGGLLKALLDAGYDAKGCEPATGLVDIARNYYKLNDDTLLNVDIDCALKYLKGSPACSAVVMWHVFEHLDDALGVIARAATFLRPQGVIIMQVPMLAPDYIYPEHYFFCTHQTYSVIASKVGLGLIDLIYDDQNLFVTAVFQQGALSQDLSFLGHTTALDPLTQTTLIFNRSRAAYRKSASRLSQINSELHAAVDAYRGVVEDRDMSIAGWRKLAEDRLIAMNAMEELILAWKKLADDRLAMITAENGSNTSHSLDAQSDEAHDLHLQVGRE